MTLSVDFRQQSLQVLLAETTQNNDEEEAKEFFFPKNILAHEMSMN
jgi:hypothetical protein